MRQALQPSVAPPPFLSLLEEAVPPSPFFNTSFRRAVWRQDPGPSRRHIGDNAPLKSLDVRQQDFLQPRLILFFQKNHEAKMFDYMVYKYNTDIQRAREK